MITRLSSWACAPCSRERTTWILSLKRAVPPRPLTSAQQLSPDVVLMDLQFGSTETGADATRNIRALPDAPAVLVLTNHDSDGDILGAVEARASGYLLKDAPAGGGTDCQ